MLIHALFPLLLMGSLIGAVLLHALLSPERAVARALHAETGAPIPLGMERALSERKPHPTIVIFPDSLPRAYVIRALGSAGSVFLSRGLLATFQDDEMAALLRRAASRRARFGIFWDSANAGWLARIQRFHPEPLTPVRALLGWMLFPIRSALERRTRPLDLLVLRDSSSDPAWLSASRKVAQMRRIFS